MILERKDYVESCCCFNENDYIGTPDTNKCRKSIPAPQIVSRLDALYNKNMFDEAQDFLNRWIACAKAMGDWRGELTLLSELIGLYRSTLDMDPAITTIENTIGIIKEHHIGCTISGATILLNAATTLKAFGYPELSLNYFRHVLRIYSENLDPYDYRMAGLYNNMALSYLDLGEYLSAEKYYILAIDILDNCTNSDDDLAVTYCNLAQAYEKNDSEDFRINECMENAWNYLNTSEINNSYYHIYSVKKCLSAFEYFGYFIYTQKLKSILGGADARYR